MNTFLCRRDSGKWLEASRWVVFFSFFFSFSSLYRLSIGTSQHFTSRNQMDAVKKTKSNPGKLSKGKSFSYRYRREKVFDWLLWRVAQIASGKTKWNRGVYMFFFSLPAGCAIAQLSDGVGSFFITPINKKLDSNNAGCHRLSGCSSQHEGRIYPQFSWPRGVKQLGKLCCVSNWIYFGWCGWALVTRYMYANSFAMIYFE